MLKKCITVLLLYFSTTANFIYAQSSDSIGKHDTFIINKILLNGNKITKPQIIIREILFHENDTVSLKQLSFILKQSQENLLNTSLFNFVTIDTMTVSANKINVIIDVVERWYIWPNLYFKINDRNFNVWWQTKDLSKIGYGVYLDWENFRGRKESLILLLRTGYDQTIGLAYRIPYINKRKTLGMGISGGFSGNHEIPYMTDADKQVYFKNTESYIQQNVFGTFSMTYRRNIFNTQTFQVNYNHYVFDDTLLKLNPGFSTQNHLQFFTFYYLFKSDHRDIAAYPLKGYYTEFELDRYGFGLLKDENINMAFLHTSLRKYWRMYNRWYFAGSIDAKVSTKAFQPYFLERGLGYGNDYVRSYEYYVVDGQCYALLKSNLKFELVPTKVIDLNYAPLRKFSKFYYAIYLNLIADAAYVDNWQPSVDDKLGNSFLYGNGVGLDLVTYYDKVWRFEYTFNKMGQSGFFLHFSAPI